jgi:hypothetical protein
MLTHADVPKPPAPIKVMLAANARRERVGLGPKYAQMRTLLPTGKYVYHWVIVSQLGKGGTFSSSLAG